MRSLRRRLGLTQAAFAELIAVSPNAVYQWEIKSALGLRARTRAKVLEARALRAREARLQLGASQ